MRELPETERQEAGFHRRNPASFFATIRSMAFLLLTSMSASCGLYKTVEP